MKCPGQDTKYWKEGAIFDVKCPECGSLVEFYKDDTTRRCHQCKHRFVNPKMDFGCATYCQFAEQCLGTLPEEFVMTQDSLLKDKIAIEMKRYFKTDFKSISHATRVARHAEKIGKATEGVNLALILCSAYLHNIGSVEAQKKFNSTEAKYLQLEGPNIASLILQKLGADENLEKHVCDMISHNQNLISERSMEYHILHDAYIIALLEEEYKGNGLDDDHLTTCLNNDFLSENGRLEAKSIFEKLGVNT